MFSFINLENKMSHILSYMSVYFPCMFLHIYDYSQTEVLLLSLIIRFFFTGLICHWNEPYFIPPLLHI